MSKRQEIKERRRREKRRKQFLTGSIISVIILLVAGIIIYPSLEPIGEIAVPEVKTRSDTVRTTMGLESAPVKVQELSDFQCSACKQADEILGDTIIAYAETGSIYFEYIPFSFLGPESFSAAEAAYCAADQEMFWEYHDILFANQTATNSGDFTDRRLVAFAEEIGLDKRVFESCFDQGKYAQQLQDNVAYGQSQNIPGTPSYLVNGKLVGANELIQTIEEALAAN